MRAHFLRIYFPLPLVYDEHEADAYAISFGKIWRKQNGGKANVAREKKAAAATRQI